MKKPQNLLTLVGCSLLASAAGLVGPGALAQSIDTWGGNTSANLGDAGNWTTGNNPPLAGDSWLFGVVGTSGTSLSDTLASAFSVSNILFQSGASSFTISGANSIALTSSISNASTSLEVLNVPLTLSKNSTFSPGPGGGNITLGGAVSGSAGLTEVGNGNLNLTNISTGFTGPITNNSILNLTGAIGPGSAGAYNWGGSYWIDNGELIWSSANTQTFTPKADGTGGMIINGPGTFLPSPSSSWGMTGDITVNGGIYSDTKGLPSNGRSGFGSTASGTNGGQRTVTVNGPGIISVDAATAFGQSGSYFVHNLNFVVNTNGLLRVTTSESIFTNIYLNGGTLGANGGGFDMGASIIVGGSSPSFMTNSTAGVGFRTGVAVGNGYQTPFIVNPTAGGSLIGLPDLTVSAPLLKAFPTTTSVSSGISLTGGGTMLITGPNSIPGPISVNQGTLILGDPGEIGLGNYPGTITVANGATFILETMSPETNTGIMTGSGVVALASNTLYMAGSASTVAPLTLSISNGATLDVTQITGGPGLGSTINGFGTINGNVNTALGAILEGGVPGTNGTLTVNGNATMVAGSGFRFGLTTSASGANSQVVVSGTLGSSGAQVHVAAPSGQNLDTQNYTLVTSSGFSGSVSPAISWDVAPLNQNNYYATNIGNNIVLAYSSVQIPTPGGTTVPATILRNQSALLVVSATPGAGQSVTNVTVNASSIGGSSSLVLQPNGTLNTFTNTISIGAGLTPGSYILPAVAIDTTPTVGNGIIAVSVVASTETWAGLGNFNFDNAADWAIEAGQTAAYAPGYAGDSVVFAGTTGLNPIVDQTYSVNGLLFASGAGAFNVTATGGNTVSLQTAGITNLSTNVETLNLPLASAIPGSLILNPANGNLVLADGISDINGGLTLAGPALSNAVVLSGPNTFSGPLTLAQGSLTLTNTTVTETNTVAVGSRGSAAATLNVGAGATLTEANGLSLLVGSVKNSAGAITVSNGGAISIPTGGLTMGSATGSQGYFNMAGGTVDVNSYVYLSQLGDVTRFDMSGGTFTVHSNLMRIATGSGQPFGLGEADFSGGVYNSLNAETASGYGGGLWVGEYGTGVLNVSGNALLNIWGDTNLMVGVQSQVNLTGGVLFYQGQANGEVNLNGGAIVTAQVTGGDSTGTVYSPVRSTFNFNGGLLSNYNGAINWNSETPGPYFMYNISNVYVYPGGANIDDGGGNITINEALQAPTGYGITTYGVSSGGSNYVSPPVVVITNGTGSGATASAVITGGRVTALNVTSPGSGYGVNDKVTVIFYGGGGSGAAATNKAPVLNGSGGLTYTSEGGLGHGQLTLIGAATYTNATIIQSGTFSLGAGGSINNSALITVSNGATFDANGAGGLTLVSGQKLNGGGTVDGLVTAGSGSIIYPGVDPTVGTLTFGSGLEFLAGAVATFDLSTSGGGVNDQIVLNAGTLNFANNTVHIKALNPGANLDTTTPYVLFQHNSGSTAGLPSVNPVFDVAPANVGTGHWLLQPSGNNIVLLNSVNSPPSGSGSVTVGAITGTNLVRNSTITITANVSGPHTVQTVTLDLTAYGGSLITFNNTGGTTWSATFTIPPTMPVGILNLSLLAYDGFLYGDVLLPLNVISTVETWTGANHAVDQNWDDNGNWQSALAPGYIGDNLVFAGSTGLAPVMDQYYVPNSITFAANAGAFVLTSSGPVLDMASGSTVTNLSATTETLNQPIALGGAVAFNPVNGSILLPQAVNDQIAGTGVLVTGGSGTNILTGQNNYSGGTTINSGTLLLADPGTLQGGTYASPMTDNGTFAFSSQQAQSMDSLISGTGGITVNGPGGSLTNGVLTLAASNTFAGNISVANGTLVDTAPENVGTPTVSGLGNPTVVGRTVTIGNNGTVLLDAAGGNDFGNGATIHQLGFVVNPGGLLEVGAGNVTFSNITLNGGVVMAAGGVSTEYESFEIGGSILVGGTARSVITNSLGDSPGAGMNLGVNAANGHQTVFNVASTGAGGSDLAVGVVLTDSGNLAYGAISNGLIKTGAGTLLLTDQNIYHGVTTLSNGIITLGSIETPGTSGPLGNSPYTNAGSISFLGGTLQYSTVNQSDYSGRFSHAANQRVSIDVAGEPITITNPLVSIGGSLAVADSVGGGNLNLSATNTYTGATIINSGKLVLAATGSMANSTNISIAAGATLDVSSQAGFALSGSGSITGSGSNGAPASIISSGLSFGTRPITLNYNGSNAALTVSSGQLTLNGNAFTVNGPQLSAAGSPYTLIHQASGSINSSGTYTVTGTALGAFAATITVTGGDVQLTVIPSRPTMLYSISGNNGFLNISWPSAYLGASLYYLSNSVSTGIAPTGWQVWPGSTGVTNESIPIGTTNEMFFELNFP